MALVLVIDDDESVARLVADIVAFCGHEPLLETDSVHAVARWGGNMEIKALLVDLMMPRIDGIEILAIWQERRPEVRRVIITAAPQEEAVRIAKRDGLVQMVIPKPPGISDIKTALAWL